MLLEAWLLSKIADKVFSYASDKGSGIVEGWVSDKLGLEPRKKAFKRALGKASQKFEKKYPQWAADFFNGSFFEHEAAPILAQFLVQDGNPDPSELATLWARLLNIPHPERRTTLISELEPVAADFLDDMASALKAEQALSNLNDSRALDQIVSELRAIRKKMEAGQTTPGSRRDYLHWLIERNLYLDMRGTSQTQHFVRVKLEEVYISLHAQHEKTPSTVDRNLSEPELAQQETKRESVNLSIEEIENQRDLLSSHAESHPLDSKNRNEVLELAEVIKRHSHIVILGDPGSGKSTLLRHIALKYALSVSVGRNEAGSDLGTVRFPILIRIADYAEYGLPKGQPLSDFLVDYYRMHECPRPGLADLLATELVGGNCLILLDGLDEIVSADDRRKVVERVEDFILSHDNGSNRFVITSRRAGYRSAPLGGPFIHYVVEDMNEAQIQRFLERWCIAVEDAETPDVSQKTRQVAAQREIDAIMRAVRDFPGIHRLATNPLLLRLLAQLHRTIARLPRRRIELYQAAAETLARTWRIAQEIPESALEDDKHLTRLLGRLAYWLHENKPTGLATEREVYEVLGKEWAHIKKGLDWDEDNTEIEIEIKKFLCVVREHTGLFVECAPKRYGFMHLTFEEYYAACYIVRRSKDRARLIRKHLHQSRWEEPILLALGLVSPEDAEDLIETAILVQGEEAEGLGFTPSSYEEFLRRDYLFALRCLEENIPVRPGVRKRLLKRMVDELLYRTGSGRFHHYFEELEARLKYLGESEAASVLSLLLIEALPGANAQVRKQIIRSLGLLEYTSLQVINTLFTALDDVDSEVCRVSRWSLRRLELVRPSRELITALTETVRHHKNKSARKVAARFLGEYERYSPDVIVALLTALHDATPEVRSVAAWGLRSGLTAPEVVTALIAALHDAYSQVRNMAAESLGKLDRTTSQVVTSLTEVLHDGDPGVRKVAIESLERLGQSPLQVITALTEALHDTDAEIRAGVVRSLGQLEHILPLVEEAVVAALHDIDPGVRDAVAESLGQLDQDSPQVITALVEALHDIDPRVRNRAAHSLNKPRQVSSQVTALIEALHDVDNDVRATAATSLQSLDQTSPEGVAALIEALQDADFYVRRAVMRSLGHLGQKSSQAATALIEALHKAAAIAGQKTENLKQLDQTFFQDVIALLWSLLEHGEDTLNLVIENVKQSDQTVREVATLLIKALPFADHDIVGLLAQYLGELGQVSPDIIRTTIEFVQTSPPLIRFIPTVVAASLEQLDQATPGGVEVLIKYLENADPQVRELMVEGFKRSGLASPIIVQSLIRILNNDDVAVQKAAIKSLEQLDQKDISNEVVSALLTSLHNPIPEIRSLSATSLGNIGQKKTTDEITTALFNSLGDNDFTVRYAAAERLRQLGLISPKLLEVQLEALNNRSLKWKHGDIARFLGQHSRKHEAIIQSLWDKLRDEKTYARRDCAQALALLGQHFPDIAETIGKKLVQAIEDPDLSKTDEWGWSGCDLAYEALQLLVTDGEPNKR
jgi:HEAT repeat protein